MERPPSNRPDRPPQADGDYNPRDLRARRPPPPDPARRANNNQPQQDGGPRRSSVAQLNYMQQQRQEQHQPPPQPVPAPAPVATIAEVEVGADWKADDEAMLALYGTVSTTEWTSNEADQDNLFGSPKPEGAGTAVIPRSAKGDENDPLGLMRGGVLAANPDMPNELRSAVLLHSKAFDPKVFLSTVHPNATFKDLNMGRERLQSSLEERSGALKQLVQAEWDRFVGVKGATESVYEEMKQGPLAPDADHGIKLLRDTLKQATSRADTVFQPILDARTKAERLKSTLGVFERSKFFFNLPTILGEAVEEGKYELALQSYKKGRYILASRPAQLLGLPIATTAQQKAQQQRIYDKVWGQVEKIIGDLRATLGKRLRDTKRGLDEVEKTIEILLELDPSDDPVWIFFDTHHRHILQLLRTSTESSMSRVRIAMDQYGEEFENDRKAAADLRAGVASLEALEGETVRENAAGVEVWRLTLELVKQLNEVLLQTLPSFWKVAKGYMEGKYQKKNSNAAANARRSPTQCKVMTQDIVTLYVTLLSQFFTLSSTRATPTPDPNADPGASPPLPPFVPPVANGATNCHWLLKILNELSECQSELAGLELSTEANASLKELMQNTRWRFEEAICAGWVRDAKGFYRLETWQPDPDNSSTTTYLRQVAAFQRFNAISAYRVAGGSEERANALMGTNSTTTGQGRGRQELEFGPEFSRKLQTNFLDALYSFLDGLVHVAFADPDTIFAAGKTILRRPAIEEAEDERPKEVDVRNVDTRILLTVSNLTHLRESSIPRLINQFQAAFKVDMSADIQMLHDVTDQLDKILFDDYIKRKSADVAKIMRKGVLGGTVDWSEAPKPTEVHPFIYDALLSLVLVHAQVSATARPLVARTLGSLVEELAQVALDAFAKIERFGMGGMLQATLEIEFMHQTLSQHVSPLADTTLQAIYKTISQAYYRRPSPDGSGELQAELEGLKRTLVASRRATALQFLCFRRPRAETDKDKTAAIARQGRREALEATT